MKMKKETKSGTAALLSNLLSSIAHCFCPFSADHLSARGLLLKSAQIDTESASGLVLVTDRS